MGKPVPSSQREPQEDSVRMGHPPSPTLLPDPGPRPLGPPVWTPTQPLEASPPFSPLTRNQAGLTVAFLLKTLLTPHPLPHQLHIARPWARSSSCGSSEMTRLVSQVRREHLFSQVGLDLQHLQALAPRSDAPPQVSHLPPTTPVGCDYDHSHHHHSNPLDPWRLTPKAAPGQR